MNISTIAHMALSLGSNATALLGNVKVGGIDLKSAVGIGESVINVIDGVLPALKGEAPSAALTAQREHLRAAIDAAAEDEAKALGG